VRNSARLLLSYGANGQLQLRVENAAVEQSEKPEWSNSTEPLNGGWPSYEFGDGSTGFSGILRRQNGEPSVILSSRSTADTPNRLTAEFQDALNVELDFTIEARNLRAFGRANQARPFVHVPRPISPGEGQVSQPAQPAKAFRVALGASSCERKTRTTSRQQDDDKGAAMGCPRRIARPAGSSHVEESRHGPSSPSWPSGRRRRFHPLRGVCRGPGPSARFNYCRRA
jgi:hypothetical protein